MTARQKGQQPVAPLPTGYPELLESLKARIRQAQVRAALSVNRELVLLYWQIGREILQRQEQEGWGAKVIDRLAQDLRREFPEMKGLSRANLFYMRAFAEAWPDEPIVQQLVGQIPWGHHCVLLDKVKSRDERLWYVQQTLEYGWSRNVLVHQIETSLYQRQGKAITNFQRTLPAPQSDLAHSLLKDPYVFDFLSLGPEAQERDLEHALIGRLRDFLLELGKGFALVGSQYHLEVGGEDFYLDLLFYQLRLRCYVVIELKIGEFRPEDTGKMNFYLSAVDDILRHPEDRPSIGLILCKSQNRVIAEYALRDVSKPMGVATYRMTTALPAELQESLPSIEELEKELGYGG
ncbi:MAG TPA: PDDEXK nuclease domain-containing protein [Candidatus Bipolaricaulis anaerobius]|jgi:predicted nuclease of restriction endonuclease-like (RecB) superfamily|nr:PDDEXK nuclease domain-containing protein [Candidatus Bipolaricaulis anaerobius]HNS24182.1 PDDEXK nuclease domain-containing protein [Candidatus Bipolaricaulis anaerobius]